MRVGVNPGLRETGVHYLVFDSPVSRRDLAPVLGDGEMNSELQFLLLDLCDLKFPCQDG